MSFLLGVAVGVVGTAFAGVAFSATVRAELTGLWNKLTGRTPPPPAP